MNEPKFTPGPWKIHDAYKEAKPFIVNEDGGPSWVAYQLNVSQGNKLISNVSGMTVKNSGYPRVQNFDEVKANAHLIAAAPEMYEALARCVHQLNLAGHDRLSVDPVVEHKQRKPSKKREVTHEKPHNGGPLRPELARGCRDGRSQPLGRASWADRRLVRDRGLCLGSCGVGSNFKAKRRG